MIFFLTRRVKNDSNYFHECVIEKFLRIQSLDQQIKIYEYFSFDNRAQNVLSLSIFRHDTTTCQILAICRTIVMYKECVFWRINKSCKALSSNFQIVKSEGQRFEASSEVDIILSPALDTSKYDRYFFHSLVLYFKLFFYVI